MVWAATLSGGGPTGGFFYDGELEAWGPACDSRDVAPLRARHASVHRRPALAFVSVTASVALIVALALLFVPPKPGERPKQSGRRTRHQAVR